MCAQPLRACGRLQWRPLQAGRGNALVVCMAHSLVPTAPLGLYNPEDDRDACGVGFVAELNKVPTRACVVDAIEALRRMTHRGACGCEVNTGLASLLCFVWSAGLWPVAQRERQVICGPATQLVPVQQGCGVVALCI